MGFKLFYKNNVLKPIRITDGLKTCLIKSLIATGLAFLVSLAFASTSLAADKFCSDAPYFGVIDGDRHPVPTQITIDRDCTFQNFPASNPLTSTLNFQTNDPSIYLIIFNNVIFTGHMACANVDHRIWFANGSDYGSSNSCQDLFIPVESIKKESPAATASVGVPFTYTLTMPSMTLVGGPSLNDLHTVTLWDDLTQTGADLTFVGINAYNQNTGAPITLVPETDPNAPGGVWTPKNLSYEAIPLINQGDQIVVEITVVLDDTANNTIGKTFVNTAKWSFGRLIEGVFYEPLPGEWGVSAPMTISGPNLIVTKSSSETALNLGIPAAFTVNVQNVGGTDAWNTTVVDQIPEDMCDYDPTQTPGIAASILAPDGSTVATLSQNTHYTATFVNPASPGCTLTLEMISDQAKIPPDHILSIRYQSELNGSVTTDGLTLTNVAGAHRWYSADPNGGFAYQSSNRTLTDGTPGIQDHQDSQTVTTALSGYYFQKTVANLDTGIDPASSAYPGDTLRYKVRLFNVDQTIDSISITDPIDLSAFDPSSFSMVSQPANTTYSFDSASGLLTITGASGNPLNVAPGDEVVIEFDMTLRTGLANATTVSNQATINATGINQTESDDPYVNGISSPTNGPPPDPTVVVIQSPGGLTKAINQPNASIGEVFTYTITIPETPIDVPLYDVQIRDNLAASNAALEFVSANVVSGGSWLLSNSGTPTNPIIGDAIVGIDIPVNGQALIDIAVRLQNTVGNQSGFVFTNSADYTYNRVNGNNGTRLAAGSGVSPSMVVIEPEISATKSVSFINPAGKSASDPAMVGDVLEYRITLENLGSSTAYDLSIVDTLPADLSLVAGSAAAQINGSPVAGFVVAPDQLASGDYAWGQLNGDESMDLPVGQTLVLTYQLIVESVSGTDITNTAYTQWTSLNGVSSAERTGTGCPLTTAPNGYCFGPVSAVVSTLDNTSITKAVVGDSYAEIPPSSGAPIVRVGDSVTYALSLNLQEYTTRNVAVEDLLPAGLELESFTINGGQNFSYSLSTQPSIGATGLLRWEFGDITNIPSNDGTPIDTLTIEYVARVVTDAAPTGVPVVANISRQNQASLSYASGDPNVYPNRLRSSQSIDVRQPLMSPVSKVDLGTNRQGSGTQADPYQVNISTDIMSFEISSCNTGQAPAYGVVISDQLAPEFDETGLLSNPPVVSVGSRTLNENADYQYTPPAGNGGSLLFVLQDSAPVLAGECVTVNYDIGFQTNLTDSRSWSNQAQLQEYYSLPGIQQGRLYVSNTLAQLWMTNLVNEEQLLTTLLSGNEATIGDEVVYQLRVPAIPVNRALTNVVISGSLDTVLEYVSVSAVNAAGQPVTFTDTSSGGQVTLGVTSIDAGQQVIVTLTTRVLNIDQATAGYIFTNTASYTYSGKPADLDTSSTSAPVKIVEPLVNLATTVTNVTNPGTPPNIGDILRFSASLNAAGGVAGDDFTQAFDLSLQDSLSLGLAYQAGTVQVDGTGNSISDPTVTGDGVGTPQTLTWQLSDATADVDLNEGSTVTISYDVLVLNQVQAGQLLSNAVVAQWTSQDGLSSFERDGSGIPGFNDYVTGPVNQSLRAELSVTLNKAVVNVTSGQNPGVTAEPGDQLQFTIDIQNQSIAPLVAGQLIDDLAEHFVPGSLQFISSSDPTVDTSAVDAFGGRYGTGLLAIGNINLAEQGSQGDSVTIVFSAVLAPVIDNGTDIINQTSLSGDDLSQALSNPTSTIISSAPLFTVQKTSTDLSNDPDVLAPGDTLRYTITVRNLGNENAINATLTDAIPVHTQYVSNSTTLNGAQVSDLSSGASPLETGLIINAPSQTSGFMPADASAGTQNAAIVTFDVMVDASAVDGTIITNQGFFLAAGAGSGPLAEQPSDDPSTTLPDDPTRDVVGDVPLVDAHKTVEIFEDNGSLNVVDPGDVLRYTIVITNDGSAPATEVVFKDNTPVGTSYLPNTVFLNGLQVADPSTGGSPLESGIPVSSSGLTTSLPGPGAGELSPNSQAVIRFDVRVDAAVSAGTIISNQGTVSLRESSPEPTDADGIDSNGDQPTEVVVGNEQAVSLIKTVAIVGNGPAVPGSTLEYVLQATNISSLAATNLVFTDDLTPLVGLVTYLPGSARLNGSGTGINFSNNTLTADYAAVYGDLPPGAVAELRFQAQISATAPLGTTLDNVGVVSWSSPTKTATANISIGVGGVPGSAALNGVVWRDTDLDSANDVNEASLANWSVELYRGTQLLASVQTDPDGAYRLSGLSSAGSPYTLRFIAPGAGPNTPSLGWPISTFTNRPQEITDIVVAPGDNLQSLSLPVTPNGVVYDSVLRTPVVGASLTLINHASDTPVPVSCFDDPSQQGQVTAANGFYKFDLNFSGPACPSGATYTIIVTPPGQGYQNGASEIMHTDLFLDPDNGQASAFSVTACPGTSLDALPATVEFCEVSDLSDPPAVSVQPNAIGTQYALSLVLSNGTAATTNQVFNNHIPVDPVLDGAVAITKVSSLINVVKSQQVPYTITISNRYAAPLYDISLVDQFPAGFKYVAGSATLDGAANEPQILGRQLIWNGIDLQVNETLTYQILLVVGAGVGEGEYTNQAQVINPATGGAVSGLASATVRVVPDPTFDCTDVIGKVFDDRNLNGYQDDGESGLQGVRIVSARGLTATTDPYGRFHMTCAATPDADRGSNFILKLDDHSLPSGFRVTTENPRVLRATRGKVLAFNFGATIHRVVGLDCADGVFEPETTELRIQWHPRLKTLIDELKTAPSVLRLSYLADVEKEQLVQERVDALRQEIKRLWNLSGALYPLTVETEIYWRRGSPPEISGRQR